MPLERRQGEDPPPVWTDLQHCRFSTGWRHAAPRGRCGWHQHPDLEIVYHPIGRGETYCKDGSRFDYQADSVVIYPAHMQHDQVMFSNGDDWCVQIRLPEQLTERFTDPWVIPALENDTLRSDIRHLTKPAVQANPLQAGADHARATALLAALIDRQSESRIHTGGQPSAHLERAQHYMSLHYGDLGSLDEVAAHCSISADRLRRIFVEAVGMPPKRWLTTLRIERSRDLLRHSNLTLRDIAAHCGFAHERHFSDSFRLAVGCAPGAWRREQA